MSGGDYVKKTVNEMLKYISDSGRKLDGNVYSVIHTEYSPDLDVSPVLNGN